MHYEAMVSQLQATILYCGKYLFSLLSGGADAGRGIKTRGRREDTVHSM